MIIYASGNVLPVRLMGRVELFRPHPQQLLPAATEQLLRLGVGVNDPLLVNVINDDCLGSAFHHHPEAGFTLAGGGFHPLQAVVQDQQGDNQAAQGQKNRRHRDNFIPELSPQGNGAVDEEAVIGQARRVCLPAGKFAPIEHHHGGGVVGCHRLDELDASIQIVERDLAGLLADDLRSHQRPADDAAPQIDFKGCKDGSGARLPDLAQDINRHERLPGRIDEVRCIDDDGIRGERGCPPQHLLIGHLAGVFKIQLVGPRGEFLPGLVQKRVNVSPPARDHKHPPRPGKQIQRNAQRARKVRPLGHVHHHAGTSPEAAAGVEQGKQRGVGKEILSLSSHEISGQRSLDNNNADTVVSQLIAQQIDLVGPMLAAGLADEIQMFDEYVVDADAAFCQSGQDSSVDAVGHRHAVLEAVENQDLPALNRDGARGCGRCAGIQALRRHRHRPRQDRRTQHQYPPPKTQLCQGAHDHIPVTDRFCPASAAGACRCREIERRAGNFAFDAPTQSCTPRG